MKKERNVHKKRKKKEMYIKKEGSCRISIEKKIRFFIKKRRFFSLQKKEGWKKKEG